jgi:hypothetical protein
MYQHFKNHLNNELAQINEAGLFKNERIIVSAQNANIKIADGKEVLNFCANNYLGLSNNAELIKAAKQGLDSHGYGMSSVRFICGTQDLHKQLEKSIADFFGTEDTILYAACFDANGGLFEPLFGEEDAIVSDSLNHASIIVMLIVVVTAIPIAQLSVDNLAACGINVDLATIGKCHFVDVEAPLLFQFNPLNGTSATVSEGNSYGLFGTESQCGCALNWRHCTTLGDEWHCGGKVGLGSCEGLLIGLFNALIGFGQRGLIRSLALL